MTQSSLFDDAPASPSRTRVIVECDGGSRGNPGPAAIGAVVLDGDAVPESRIPLAEVSECIGVTTNNVAEYKAVIAALEVASERFASTAITVRADSKLVIEQLAGRWKVKQDHLIPLHRAAREQLRKWQQVELTHVPRERNKAADALVNRALDAQRAARS